MKIPSFLQEGDQVAIVATARKTNVGELDYAINLLKKWNLVPVIGSSIGKSFHQFAGTDAERAEDFQQQIDDPDIKAIWCARGGYGTIRMLDKIDFSRLLKNPKWIVGYSDVTALHTYLQKNGIASLHAEMPVLVQNKNEETTLSLKQLLFGRPWNYQWNHKGFPYRTGKVKGRLVGGNLSVLYSVLGSDTALDPAGKILFIEDLDEYLYHIDRMVQNLKRNHWFENLKGLVVGGLNDMNDNTVPFGQTAEEIIWETVKAYDFPVSFGFPAGHLYNNQAMIFGAEIELEITNAESSMIYTSINPAL